MNLAIDGIGQIPVERIHGVTSVRDFDDVSIEEPLQISVAWEDKHGSHMKQVAITMRTPGDDSHLAAGFLFTEGIISDADEIAAIETASSDTVVVILRAGAAVNMSLLDRHSFVSSSCGACGKRSLDAVRVARQHEIIAGAPMIGSEVVHALPDILRQAQAEFTRTGGIHASAFFNAQGTLIALREDVGRHNALDKLIGSELMARRIPLSEHILLVSGRVSFELVQKAAIAGVPVIAAIGAPSSLAVELAAECGITLLGFVRGNRFNIYNDRGRILDSHASELATA